MEKVSDEQIQRMVVVVNALAESGNSAAIGIARALQGKPLEAQRNLVLGFYGVLFEMLTCLHMALDSTKSIDEITTALKRE